MPSYTGRQTLGEEALTELAGITHVDRYWLEGKALETPLYIDGSNPAAW